MIKNKEKLVGKEFDKDIANAICNKVKAGSGLSEICEFYDMTPNDIKRWACKDKDFSTQWHDALSLYSQKKIESIDELIEISKDCDARNDLTKLKSVEVRLTCITKSLAYQFPEKYKEKSNELFINLPEYGEATTPKERLNILAKAVCDKRISVDAAEKLARMCEIELRVTDFAVFAETVAGRIDRLEGIIVKTNGLIPANGLKANKEAQY
jgi:hypothetical protein